MTPWELWEDFLFVYSSGNYPLPLRAGEDVSPDNSSYVANMFIEGHAE